MPRIEIVRGEEADERGKESGRCGLAEDSGVVGGDGHEGDDRRVLLPLGGGKDSLVAWYLCRSEDRLQPVLMYVCDGDDEYDRSWRLQGLVRINTNLTAKSPLYSSLISTSSCDIDLQVREMQPVTQPLHLVKHMLANPLFEQHAR